jgi:hypothetical protein
VHHVFVLKMRARIALLLGAYVATGFMVVLLILGLRMNKSVTDTAKAFTLGIVAASAAQVSSLVDKMHWQLRILAQRPEFLSKDRKVAAATIAGQRSVVSPEVAGLLLAWPDGSYVSSAGETGSIADQDYFRQLISGSVSFVVGKPDLSK